MKKENSYDVYNLNYSMKYKLTIFLLLLASLFLGNCGVNNDIFNITAYGASESNTLNTTQIQAAVDACFGNGGGTVLVPKGKFVTGTIFLKANVTLHLAAEAELSGSTNLKDYAEVEKPVEAPRFAKVIVYAVDQDNISITGDGTIDGRGSEENFDHWGERPMLMRFIRCNDLRIEGVTLKYSASWNTHLIECERVHVDKIHLYNRMQGNNDGIDFDSCKDLFITNSIFDTEDDPICGKSTTNKSCENIVVSNCIIKSNCSGFKLGTSSKGIYRNITVTNSIFKGMGRGAIKLICVDGGQIDGVNISNIVMDSVQGPIFIRLGGRGKTYEVAKDQDYSKEGMDAISSTPIGQIKNINISNVSASIFGLDTVLTAKAQSGIMITGLPNHPVENVKISNARIMFPGGGKEALASIEVPEDAKRYPEQSFFGELPSYALYARHVNELRFNDCIFKYKKEDQRPAIVLDDVHNSEFDLIRMMSPSSNQPLIRTVNSENILFDRIRSLNNGSLKIEHVKID